MLLDNSVESKLIQSPIWHSSHASVAFLTQNIIHNLLHVNIIETLDCRMTISITYSSLKLMVPPNNRVLVKHFPSFTLFDLY